MNKTLSCFPAMTAVVYVFRMPDHEFAVVFCI